MRSNAGIATIELLDTRNSSVLMRRQVDVSTITEGTMIELAADDPIETVYGVPLMLRITADSVAGTAASPLMSVSVQREGETLLLNGVKKEGTLCFSVSGEDYIWTGLHYWEITAVGGALLLICCGIVAYRANKEKELYRQRFGGGPKNIDS